MGVSAFTASRRSLLALDKNGSGTLTSADVATPQHVVLEGPGGSVSFIVDRHSLGRAVRLYEHARIAPSEVVRIPAELLTEAAPDRALLACDSYESTFRSMAIPDVLDAIVDNPDPKLGVFGKGLRDESGRFRSYKVVGKDGALVERTATYDGQKAYLYVPADEQGALQALQQRVKTDPKYARVEVRAITKEELASHEERMRLKYDRPGLFWVSSRSPAVPHLKDDGYIVPGGRFGIELYYHDTRINLPSARSTVEEAVRRSDRAKAEQVLSAMRGTVNSLCNSVLHYGKVFNATLTVNAGRSQAPCLTNGILETYRAWLIVHPEQKADAKKWLAWAVDAAKREYDTVWTAKPRYDDDTGLSRYIDESASVAPEEDPAFYEGMEWSADDIASDAAIREHGWDSMPQALISSGPDQGKPRVHHLLPVCLNALLYRYEKDLAALSRELEGGRSVEATKWDARAEKRARTMRALMWNEEKGLFIDVVKRPGEPATSAFQNGHEDLRSFAPLWAGMVPKGSHVARRMHERIVDFMRPGGLATATASSWDALHALNAAYTERCQWGHKDIGWPIATYETVDALRRAGFSDTANEIAYRWCLMTQTVMDTHGGVRFSERGGYEAPIFEKMDVSRLSPGGAASVGYGNQGGGDEGKGAGFRWGLDAYKLLFRSLPPELQAHLRNGTAAEALFVERSGRSSSSMQMR